MGVGGVGLFVVYGWDHSDCGMQPVLVVLMRVIGSSGDVMRLPRRVGGGGCRRFFATGLAFVGGVVALAAQRRQDSQASSVVVHRR